VTSTITDSLFFQILHRIWPAQAKSEQFNKKKAIDFKCVYSKTRKQLPFVFMNSLNKFINDDFNVSLFDSMFAILRAS